MPAKPKPPLNPENSQTPAPPLYPQLPKILGTPFLQGGGVQAMPILRDPPQLRDYLARIFHPKIFRGPPEIGVF